MSSTDTSNSAEGGPVIDLDEVLERFGGDRGLVLEVASVFLEDYAATLERIRAAVAAGDAEALHRAAHALKGSVSNFAAHEAREAALALEAIGRQGDLAGAPAGLERLEGALERLDAALRAIRDG